MIAGHFLLNPASLDFEKLTSDTSSKSVVATPKNSNLHELLCNCVSKTMQHKQEISPCCQPFTNWARIRYIQNYFIQSI